MATVRQKLLEDRPRDLWLAAPGAPWIQGADQGQNLRRQQLENGRFPRAGIQLARGQVCLGGVCVRRLRFVWSANVRRWRQGSINWRGRVCVHSGRTAGKRRLHDRRLDCGLRAERVGLLLHWLAHGLGHPLVFLRRCAGCLIGYGIQVWLLGV